MEQKIASTFDIFNRDAANNTGYLYTTNARLSSQMANQRLSDITQAMADFRGKRILDIGCGDGTYTVELYDRSAPALIHASDPAQQAIDVARHKVANRNIIFESQSAYALPYATNSYDIAHIRGVLHHLDKPFDALQEAFRVAPTVFVIEPNGYNPVLKLLERCSRYHVEHIEKSYAANQLDHWITKLGGSVQRRAWVGLVPFFCPDWFARAMKTIEPVVEKTPLANVTACAVYVMVATRPNPY